MFKVYIITIFPECFPSILDISVLGKARKEKKWQLNLIDLKKHATNNHRCIKSSNPSNLKLESDFGNLNPLCLNPQSGNLGIWQSILYVQ